MIHKVLPQLHAFLTPIADLVLDPENAMDHDERSIESIADSLKTYGQDIPVIAQQSDRVVKIGNGRVQAASRLGWTHVAVLFRDDDKITMVGRALADNRTAQLSNWNKDFLSQAVAMLDEANHAKVGWMEDELQRIMAPPTLHIPDDIVNNILPVAPPNLPVGDRSPFQQMTFTLHDSQVELIHQALEAAKKKAVPFSGDNQNSNGNALARIAEAYLGNG